MQLWVYYYNCIWLHSLKLLITIVTMAINHQIRWTYSLENLKFWLCFYFCVKVSFLIIKWFFLCVTVVLMAFILPITGRVKHVFTILINDLLVWFLLPRQWTWADDLLIIERFMIVSAAPWVMEMCLLSSAPSFPFPLSVFICLSLCLNLSLSVSRSVCHHCMFFFVTE